MNTLFGNINTQLKARLTASRAYLGPALTGVLIDDPSERIRAQHDRVCPCNAIALSRARLIGVGRVTVQQVGIFGNIPRARRCRIARALSRVVLKRLNSCDQLVLLKRQVLAS